MRDPLNGSIRNAYLRRFQSSSSTGIISPDFDLADYPLTPGQATFTLF